MLGPGKAARRTPCTDWFTQGTAPESWFPFRSATVTKLTPDWGQGPLPKPGLLTFVSYEMKLATPSMNVFRSNSQYTVTLVSGAGAGPHPATTRTAAAKAAMRFMKFLLEPEGR